ncbi:MAG: hypothetical protein FJW40_07500 [Acidobacteria bacterium]|nr:hypothetical protein [Acidobacteriota bacterium]
MKTSLRSALFGVLCTVAAQTSAQAQVLYGSIVGTVNDGSGAATPGATVTAVNKQTGQQRTATTNDAGGFTFVAVQPGQYELKVTKEGFRAAAEPQVEVSANNATRADFALQVGSINESITVEATGATLQTDSATVKAEMQGKTLKDLPVPVGRNYQMVLVTIPGFSPPQNAHSVPTNPSRSLQSNVNGAPTAGVNVRLDGASSQQSWLPHISAYVPSLEAIETVNVVTNSFSAEQGLAGGAAINVQIKSGTNEFHGSGFWYNNNNKLLAKPFTFALLNQQNNRNPKYVFNQDGGSLGGPIVKNKLFFFAAYEATTRREFANNNGTLATNAMRRGDLSEGLRIFAPNPGIVYDPTTGNNLGQGRTPFAGNIIPSSRISPISQAIIAKVPTVADNFRDGNFFAQGGFLFDRHTIDTKFNYNISEKWTAYGRYSALKYNMANPGMLGEAVGPGISPSGGNTGDANGTTHSTTIASTYVLNPSLILDANFGYTIYNTAVEQPLGSNVGLDTFKIPGTNGSRRFEGGWPRFTFAGFTTLGVPDSFMPYERRDPQIQYVANLNWTRGTHQIRFGVDVYKQHMNHLQAEFAGQNHGAQGGFNFQGGPTILNGGSTATPFNTWGSFLLGQASNYGTTYQVPDVYATRTDYYSTYVQDTWQVNQKLTLNYGLRYENIPMPRREDRGMEHYDFKNNKLLVCGAGQVPTNCGVKLSNLLFAPRLGVAYRPNEKTVIRTGFGINWDPFNPARALRTNYPILLILNGNPDNSFVPAGTLAAGIPRPVIPNIGNGILDLPPNYAVQSMPDKFQRAYIMSWNFTVQREIKGFTAQAGYVANRTIRQTNFLDLNAGQVIGQGNNGRPFFPTFRRTTTTAVVSPLGHSNYDSLQVKVDRRMASGLNFGVAYTLSRAFGVCCNASNDGGPAVAALSFMHLNNAFLGFDRRHNFQTTYTWELPFGKGKQMATSGAAAAILGGWQVTGILSKYTGAPFTAGADGNSLNMPGSTQFADQLGEPRKLGGYGRGQAYYDWTTFKSVTDASGRAEARFGTGGLNRLRGPGIFNTDLGVHRSFKANERVNIQFRAEALNLTNTPQLGQPSGNISGLRLANGNFTGGVFEITGTANTGRDGLVQRAIRLGLRVSF